MSTITAQEFNERFSLILSQSFEKSAASEMQYVLSELSRKLNEIEAGEGPFMDSFIDVESLNCNVAYEVTQRFNKAGFAVQTISQRGEVYYRFTTPALRRVTG